MVPIPGHYLDLEKARGEGGVTTSKVGTTEIVKPVSIPLAVLSEAGQMRMLRFIRTLHQIPPDRQERAIAAATEVLLDHLPDAPTPAQ